MTGLWRRPDGFGMVSRRYDPEGGAAAGPGTIARALRDRGHDVDVVTGYPTYPVGRVFDGYRQRPYQREVLEGVMVHRAPIFPSHDTRAARPRGQLPQLRPVGLGSGPERPGCC